MRKLLISIVAILTISFYALAQMNVVVYQKDGTKITYLASEVDSIGFSEKAEPIAVDLGLSVKWANFNVGASAPEEYGDYFAWGETETKDYYDWNTYKWCEGTESTINQYCPELDNRDNLSNSDDAAYVAWGGSWRMPTKEEMSELLDTEKCIWTWTTVNDVKGYEVKSKINGNTIFLPAAGYRWRGSFYSRGMIGDYSTKSVNLEEARTAYFLQCTEEGRNTNDLDVIVQPGFRQVGLSIRPVMQ